MLSKRERAAKLLDRAMFGLAISQRELKEMGLKIPANELLVINRILKAVRMNSLSTELVTGGYHDKR